MPRYLVSGKDADGHSKTEAIKAVSADEAVRKFRDQGYSDVVLHSDEVFAHMFQPETLKHFTPQECLALGRISRRQFLVMQIGRLYRRQWLVFLATIAFVVGRRILEVRWDIFDSIAIAYLGMPIALVLLSELFSPGRQFDRIMAFHAWGRWADMLATLPRVQSAIGAQQYAFLEAKALAGLGHIDEALERVRPFADDPKTPAWLYWGQLADVFQSAKLGERVIECGEKAVECAPENSTVLIDLTMAVLRYRRDAVRARQIMERVRQLELSDILVPFLTVCEGVAALEEKQAERARTLIYAALEGLQKFRNASPLMGAVIDRTHAYLALACAASGDSLAAEKHFRIAEPRLRAFDSTDLIERCQSVIGRL